MSSQEKVRPWEELRDNVGAQVGAWSAASLSHGGGADRSQAVATLAALRQASPADLGRSPEVWSAVVECVPVPLRGRGDEPSRAELAAFFALSMYAVHQQSQRESVYKRGASLGNALGQLARSSAHGQAAMTRRFGALITSDGPEELFHHLRSLVSLMRTARLSDGRPLGARVDYGSLAVDLLQLLTPDYAPGARLRWGRDFTNYRPDQTPAVEDNPSITNEPKEGTP